MTTTSKTESRTGPKPSLSWEATRIRALARSLEATARKAIDPQVQTMLLWSAYTTYRVNQAILDERMSAGEFVESIIYDLNQELETLNKESANDHNA